MQLSADQSDQIFSNVSSWFFTNFFVIFLWHILLNVELHNAEMLFVQQINIFKISGYLFKFI